ncbi:MAG: hypothetical protein RLZZ516_1640, partial [Cyanobacteriota bacterium]
PEQPLAFLATQLHGQLQQLLQADAPLQALAAISAALADNPSVVLGGLSFNGQLSFSSLQIEQQLSDQAAAAVMAAMKRRLLALL